MPDVLFLLSEHNARRRAQYWETADVVLEVVGDTPRDRERDLVCKRAAYARGHIPEYWIVDPEIRRITVLTSRGDRYQEYGVFTQGEKASSVLLPGFSVDVDEVFAEVSTAKVDA